MKKDTASSSRTACSTIEMGAARPLHMGCRAEPSISRFRPNGPQRPWKRSNGGCVVVLAMAAATLSSSSVVGAFSNRAYNSRREMHRGTIPPLVVNGDYREMVLEPETRLHSPNVKYYPTAAPNSPEEKKPKPFATALPRASSQQKLDDSSSSPSTTKPDATSSSSNSAPPRPDEDFVCRVVAASSSKLPSSHKLLPPTLHQYPHILRRLDDIYHAMAHDETRLLKYYMQSSNNNKKGSDDDDDENAKLVYHQNAAEERELVQVTRKSLEDAGFELLSRRNLDLCEALNSGYLLRLSIEPDVSELDPGIAAEFYPERFNSTTGGPLDPDELLFDGRVLVYRRGYSQEISKGRLILPKLDYLQASLVQRSASWVRRKMNDAEEVVAIQAKAAYRRAASFTLRRIRSLVDRIPNPRVSQTLSSRIPSKVTLPPAPAPESFIQLSRYGGSKRRFVGSPDANDALTPFLSCTNVGSASSSSSSSDGTYCAPCPLGREKKMADLAGVSSTDSYYDCDKVNGDLKCPYDVGRLGPDLARPSTTLLERVTISNLINVFSRQGRRQLVSTIFSKSELVEPTYEEVVVVWRPLPKEQPKKPVIAPPKFVYELADMFDVEGLPHLPSKKNKPCPSPLEIRTFDGVPMANLPAVLPKTKLVFRPADAFVFDLVSIFSLLLVVGSRKFDSARLDLLAIVSVSLWVLRTILRYSNKLARYDLLVKKFLTSKISHRNAGAVKYIVSEAGSQRATRAALVHSWLSRRKTPTASRAKLVRDGSLQVNELIRSETEIPVNIDAALNDLEDLELVKCVDDQMEVVSEPRTVIKTLKGAWDTIFDGKMSLQALAGRRGTATDAM